MEKRDSDSKFFGSRFLTSGATLFLGVGVGMLLVAYFAAGTIYDYEDTIRGNDLPETDVIVCLSGGIGRIDAASRLWLRYWQRDQKGNSADAARTPILYLSGLGPKATWESVKRQMSAEVLNVLKRENVVLENESSDTRENADWLVNRAADAGWKKIVLVTATYHMKRALYIFNHVFKQNELGSDPGFKIDTYSIYRDPFARNKWTGTINGVRVTTQEYIKWISYQALFR